MASPVYTCDNTMNTPGETMEWEKLLEQIDEMLEEDSFLFATETLEGIKKWITENEHCTPAQVTAVQNIFSSVDDT